MSRRWRPDRRSSASISTEDAVTSPSPKEWEAALGVARQGLTSQKQTLHEQGFRIEATSDADSAPSMPMDLLATGVALGASAGHAAREQGASSDGSYNTPARSSPKASGISASCFGGEPRSTASGSFELSSLAGDAEVLQLRREVEELRTEIRQVKSTSARPPTPQLTATQPRPNVEDPNDRSLMFRDSPKKESEDVEPIPEFEISSPSASSGVSTTQQVRQHREVSAPADVGVPKCQVAAKPVPHHDAGGPTADAVQVVVDVASPLVLETWLVSDPAVARQASESSATTGSLVTDIGSMSPAVDSPPSSIVMGSMAPPTPPPMNPGTQIGSGSRTPSPFAAASASQTATPSPLEVFSPAPIFGRSPAPLPQQLSVGQMALPIPQVFAIEQPRALARSASRELSPSPSSHTFGPPPGATANRSRLQWSMCSTSMSDGGQPTPGSAACQMQSSPRLAGQPGSHPVAGRSPSPAPEHLNQILTLHLENLVDVCGPNTRCWRSRSTSPNCMTHFVPPLQRHPFSVSPAPSRSLTQAVRMPGIASPSSSVAPIPPSLGILGSTAAPGRQASAVSRSAELEEKMVRLGDVAAEIMQMKQESGDTTRARIEETIVRVGQLIVHLSQLKQDLGDFEQARIEEHLAALFGLLRSALCFGYSSASQPPPSSVVGVPGIITSMDPAASSGQNFHPFAADGSRRTPTVPPSQCLKRISSSAALMETRTAPAHDREVTPPRAGPSRRSQSPHRGKGAATGAVPGQQVHRHELSPQPPSRLASMSAHAASTLAFVVAQRHPPATPSLSSTTTNVREGPLALEGVARAKSGSAIAPSTNGTRRPLALGSAMPHSASMSAAPAPNPWQRPLLCQQPSTPLRHPDAAVSNASVRFTDRAASGVAEQCASNSATFRAPSGSGGKIHSLSLNSALGEPARTATRPGVSNSARFCAPSDGKIHSLPLNPALGEPARTATRPGVSNSARFLAPSGGKIHSLPLSRALVETTRATSRSGSPTRTRAANPGFEISCPTSFLMASATVTSSGRQNPQRACSSVPRHVQAI